MNNTEIRDEIRKWIVEHEPKYADVFDEAFIDGSLVAVRLVHLAFKAGVDYGAAKASNLSALLHRGEQSQ